MYNTSSFVFIWLIVNRPELYTNEYFQYLWRETYNPDISNREDTEEFD